MSPELKNEVIQLIAQAHSEDYVHQDITSQSCLTDHSTISASLYLKEKARVAGLLFLPQAFEQLQVTVHCEEGRDYLPGTRLATITGPAYQILSRERTALNLIQHCSGIATQTARYVKAAMGLCDILDTRKTLPGLRQVQKYSVRMGGGKNHRFHLGERILIKSTHLMLLKGETIGQIVTRAKKQFPNAPVEVEVENLAQLSEALEAPLDFILLDNMDLATMKEAVYRIQKKCYIEASGGMTLERIPEVASLGVNGISIGALTHSVKSIDISLKIY